MISKALKRNTILTELNLVGNAIQEEGTKALCQALKTNTTLTKLDLGGGRIRSRLLFTKKIHERMSS